MPDVLLVAAVDPDLDKARATGLPAYTALGDVPGPVDFVDIATKPDTHFTLIEQAWQLGPQGVICQKPLARDLAEARAMLALGRVMVHENWRWQPWYRQAHQLIAEGAIGKPLCHQFRMRQRDGLGPEAYPNQPYFRQMPRLLLYETLIHLLDTARFLFGDIESVYAHTRRHNPAIAGEDRALVVLTHVGGVDGILDGHRWTNPDPPGPAMGDAVLEGEDGVIHILANGEVFHQGRLLTRHPTDVGYKGDSVHATQRHFIDCLGSGEPFETGVAEYLNSFAAIEAAYQSAAEGRTVRLTA